MARCFSCKRELTIEGRPGRGDACPLCDSDLKACLNCTFYYEGAYNECREPVAERVVNKGRANFCDYFQFSDSEGEKGDNKKEDALKKLRNLFGDS